MYFFFFQKGYEAVELKRNETNYRLVLSDGAHMNSYFYLCVQLNDLIVKKEIKYGTLLRIDEHKFMDGENCTNHSPRLKIKINLSKVDLSSSFKFYIFFRWIILIQKVTVLVHRNILGDPQPLMNVEKKKNPLINLNLKNCLSRVFYSIEQLENNLVSVQDLKNQPNG